MKRFLIILYCILSLVYPASIFAAENYAIREGAFPAGATHPALTSKGALGGTLASASSKTDISFTDDGSADYISSGGSDFGDFESGDTVQVSGSTSNDGFYLVATAAADKLTLESVSSLTTEGAGDTVTVQEWPTFYVINTLTYGTAKSATTRNSFPMYEGGYEPFWTWDKDHKILMTEYTGIVDGGGDIIRITTDASLGDYISAYFQTAPPNDQSVAGLLIKDATLFVEGTDVVMQHFRSLPGKDVTPPDALDLDGTRNICDHCTFGWADDELANIKYFTAAEGNAGRVGAGTDNAFTNCMFGESYRTAGSEWDSKGGYLAGYNAFVYKTFFISNYQRNPLLQGDSSGDGYTEDVSAVVINNYIHNPGGRAMTIFQSSNDYYGVNADIVGNVVHAGPDSYSDWFDYQENYLTWDDNSVHCYGLNSGTNVYQIGNCTLDSYASGNFDCQSSYSDWDGNHDRMCYEDIDSLKTGTMNSSAVVGYGFTPDSADIDLVNDILDYSGSFPQYRCEIEDRWVTEAKAGNIAEIPTSALSYPDTGDGDNMESKSRNIGTGMAAYGLENFPSDPWGDDDSDGRYNFLEWIDTITADVEGTEDLTPPVISNPQPTGNISCSSDPRDIDISVSTDEAATCKYDTSDTNYDSMGNTFSSTGGVSHSQTVAALACDASYTYYVRCKDSADNKNASSTSVSFTILAEQTPLIVVTGGGDILTTGGGTIILY